MGILDENPWAVLSQIKMRKEFEMLLTIPGIGKILGLTIMLEVGDINRLLLFVLPLCR
ncbi:MAG: transposase [Desulfobacterales bacterium]|jgi:hypothetical protein|nr:transposase [Desulfobacterales bacterium]